MIIYRYQSSWEAELINSKTSSHSTQKKSVIADHHYSDYFLTWSEFISFSKQDKSNTSHSAFENGNDIIKHTPRLAQHTIQKIMDNYDADDCIFGLFSALSQAKSRISPFIATHNYCVTILSCTPTGEIVFNVSPIYHLGPEYPEQYRQQHGMALDENAIIGLTQTPVKDPYNFEPRTFSLGIDAGIVFKNSTIPHNKLMTLCLKTVENGLMANLSCETQTTSRKFTWNFLGLEVSTPPSTNGKTKNIN